MRLSIGLLVAMLGSSMASSVNAQTPDVLFRGTVRPALSQASGAWCAVELGPTLFQRSSMQQAQMSFPAMHYALTQSAGATYFTLSGDVRLIFTTTNRGTIVFDEPTTYPTNVLRPTFTSYSETFNAATQRLIVRFRINFASCDVPVVGTYWN